MGLGYESRGSTAHDGIVGWGLGRRGGAFDANEFVYRLDRIPQLLRAEFRVHGKGKDFARDGFSHRQGTPGRRTEPPIGLGKVQGSGVMDAGGDTPLGEELLQSIAEA